MADILKPGYVRWDGTKYVFDPDVEIVGPSGPPGPSGVSTVATYVDLKALTVTGAGLVNGQFYTVQEDPTRGPWLWDSTSGASVASDEKTVVKLNETLIGNNGRFYNSQGAAVVPTFAALRAATAGIHDIITVAGRSTTSDFAGGTFRRDPTDTTSTDDDGTILVAGAHRYKRGFGGAVNAAWFGMIADTRSIVGNVSVTASSTTIGFSGTGLTSSDVGKVIQIRTANTSATGTVAVVISNLTGTVATTIGSPDIIGTGTAFTTELFVGALVKIGSMVGKVVTITDNTHVQLNQYLWGATTTGLTAIRYALVGTSTLFTTELFVGQGITISGQLYNVQSIQDNTHAVILKDTMALPTVPGTGLTLYRAPILAAKIASVNVGAHTAVISSSTATIAVSGSGLAAYVGADNAASYNAAKAAASAQKRALDIPGATVPYMFFDQIDPFIDADRGLKIIGHGWGNANGDRMGSSTWDLVNTFVTGTILRFAKGNGMVIDGNSVHELHIEGIALIGPGFGITSQGFGVLPSRAPTADQVGDVYRKIMLSNWALAWNHENSFGSTLDTANIRGNGMGVYFNNCNTQHWSGDNEIDGNGIGVFVGGSNAGLESSTIKGNFQGNVQCGVYLQRVSTVRLENCYFENNSAGNNGSVSMTWDVSTASPIRTIQQLTMSHCHFGDIYVHQPLGMFPTPQGVIDGIDDSSSSLNPILVRPAWTNWKPSTKFYDVDLRFTQGGINSLGGGAIGNMQLPNLSPIAIGPATYTPAVEDGVLRVFIVTGNLFIDTPTCQGQALSAFSPPAGSVSHFELEFHIRLTGTYSITWSAAFDGHNPWTNLGASGIARATIRFRHTGGGNWECVYYLPYRDPVFDSNKNAILNSTGANLATTSTNGFTYLPVCNGTPTGIPTSLTGNLPCIVDSSTNKLWIYVGGTWKSVTLT